MTTENQPVRFGRRNFLRYAGGAAVASAGVGMVPIFAGLTESAGAAHVGPHIHMIGTDGWINIPGTLANGKHPDDIAPAPFNAYMFGFRNVTGFDSLFATPGAVTAAIEGQKERCQHSAPIFWADEGDELQVRLTNVGLAVRPDLFDAHTLHWHGFRNVIPFFDGEPSGSVAVPKGADFVYAYRAYDPGTYMYHCHVEDIEHVHMGMTGQVYVRPAQDKDLGVSPQPWHLGSNGIQYKGFLHNDGNGSTGFHREFVMHLSEFWSDSHWADSHVQLPEWTDYAPEFSLLNGRVYPDTVAPNGGGPNNNNPFDNTGNVFTGGAANPINPHTGDPYEDGELIPPAGVGNERLQYQPISSLVECNEGERIALRFSNLGFLEQSMSTPGLTMRVVGRDAAPLKGRTGPSSPTDNLERTSAGTDLSYETDTISIGAGESLDTIIDVPAHSTGGPLDPPDVYMLYNRKLQRGNPFGGQATEIRVHPAGTLGAQSFPNT